MHNLNSEIDILAEGIKRLCQTDPGVDSLVSPRREEIYRLLSRYIAEIELFNPAYGLVGTGERGELVVKHILDSLAPLGILRRLLEGRAAAGQTPQAADVGSGAGLPGIPLAIVLPRFNFTLIERMGRRAGFLRNTQAALGLANVAVEEAEMEKTAPGRFSLVVFRALKPLEPKLLKRLFRLCAGNGALAAYKGRRDIIEEEMRPLAQFVRTWEVFPCPVPMLDEERHLLLIYSGKSDIMNLFRCN
jgi:16S rRNA (guanine527-N7)-methyltransferase